MKSYINLQIWPFKMTKLLIFRRFYNVFWKLLYSPFGPFKCHSKCHPGSRFSRVHQTLQFPMESIKTPSLQMLRNDEILKIHQVFKCFCEFRSTHILSSLNATRFPGFRAFTKCNKNQWKVTKTFKLATSKWRNYQYLTGFIMFFEHCCTALFDHFKCPPKSRLSVAHEMH